MIGYDLDGTICEGAPKRKKPFMRQNGKERAAYDRTYAKHLANARVILRPKSKEPFVIITGRKEKHREATEKWLKKNRIRAKGLFMLKASRTKENMIDHKSWWCLRIKVLRYFEDSPGIAKALALKGINVVKVGGR